MKLTTEQKIKASEIFDQGLQKAAESLTFFLKDSVDISSMKVDSLKTPREFELDNFDDQPVYCLVTELKGDITGTCLLMFKESEGLLFQEVSIGKKLESPADFEMGKELLLETDNIVAASVITEIANLLQVSMHGHVPSLDMVEEGQLYSYLENKCSEYQKALKITSKFSSEKFSINPMFVWFFDKEFQLHLDN